MTVSASLVQVLRKDNSWLDGTDLGEWLGRLLPSGYLPRQLVPRADERVCLLVGPRQVGKSTLIWRTLAQTGEPCLYLNCEEPSVRDWLVSPAGFLADVEALAPGVPSILLGQVQRLAEPGLFLKGLVDRRTGKRLFATGSSSFELEARTRESLAGRAERHLLLPLSLAEIQATLSGPSRLLEDRIEAATARHLVFGGYPKVKLNSEPAYMLADLVEAFVLRDASDSFAIRNTGAFRRVLELAASGIGNLCNISEWGSIAGISHATTGEYLRLLEETHVIRLVRPFVGGKRAEITGAAKVYFVDNGVRNQLFGGFGAVANRSDHGALLENLVFTELIKYTNPLLDTVHYWRSKSGAEVDFVVRHQGRLLAVEVKTGAVGGRLTRGTRSFLDAYAPEALLVVNREVYSEARIGQTRVRFIRAWELHGAVASFLESGAPGRDT
jgi:predicted AAA+ superfamily ATPase